MRLPKLAFWLILLGSCGGSGASITGEATRPDGPKPFDRLTIHLELKQESVESGGEVESLLIVRNDSGKPVTDGGCQLGAGRYALVPVDDPTAELWLAPIVDCRGPFTMPDGFSERYSGPTFPAATKYGDPLPPGEYIASLEIDGLSHRLERPIEVSE